MNKKFKEEKLRQDFCGDLVGQFLDSMNHNQSFSLISMPGVGATILLKYLSTLSWANFLYVDANLVPQSSEEEFFKQFLKQIGIEGEFQSKAELISLIEKKIDSLEKGKKVVFLVNHFHRLKPYFSPTFFETFRLIRALDSYKIVFIFNSNIPIDQLLTEGDLKNNLNLFSKTFYLKPYSKKDFEEIALKVLQLDVNNSTVKNWLSQAGGNYLLLLLLSKTEQQNDFYLDPFIKFELKELYDYLNFKQQKIVQKIVVGEKVNEIDSFLLNLGFLRQEDEDYKLFTPLFEEYVKKLLPLKFANVEDKIFKLLKKKLGKVVTKDEIFEVVWENDEEASDWALNSSLYRIRRNPAFIDSGYVIESYKKRGYLMRKN